MPYTYPAAFNSTELTGGNGGGVFNHYTGKPVKEIHMWCNPSSIAGIKLIFEGGESRMVGRNTGRHRSVSIDPGERITSLNVWGNGAGTRFGAFKIGTDKGDSWMAQMTSWPLKTVYPQNAYLGSGILMGMYGKSGWEIDCAGFYFLRPVISARLVNLKFQLDASDFGKVVSNDGYGVTFDNRDNGYWDEHTIEEQVREKSEHNIHHSITHNFGVDVKVNGAIPKIGGGVEASVSYSMSHTAGGSTHQSVENTRSIKKVVKVPPRKLYKFQLKRVELSLNTVWSGRISLTVDDGSKHSWPVSGSMSAVEVLYEGKAAMYG